MMRLDARMDVTRDEAELPERPMKFVGVKSSTKQQAEE